MKTPGIEISSVLRIKYQKLNKHAKDLTKVNPTDAGIDIYTNATVRLSSTEIFAIPTGIALEVPEGWYAQIAERSGFSLENKLSIKAGVIDCGYRGEIKIIVQNTGDGPIKIPANTKIAQLLILPVPQITLELVEELSNSKRGTNGFGSSDKQ